MKTPRLLSILVGCLALGGPAVAELPKPFLSHMEQVERILSDKPVFQQLKKLDEVSPERAAVIAEFWHHRAGLALGAHLNLSWESYQKMRGPINSELMGDSDGKIAKQEFNRNVELLFLSFYYDHVAQIDAMIRLNLQKAKSDKP